MGKGCKLCGGSLWVRRCLYRSCSRYGVEVREPTETVCEQCEGRLDRKSLTNPCPDCLKSEPHTILKRFEQSDRDALKAELGYSSDVKWHTFKEDAGFVVGNEWDGYALELLGIELGRFSDCVIPDEGLDVYKALGLAGGDNGRLWVKCSQLFPFTCIPDHADPDLIIKLCRIRACYRDSPLYSEMRAHPYGVRRVSIHGLEHKHTAKDRERAYKGLDLIRAAAKKLGRKKGTRFYLESEFRKRAPAAYREFYKREGDHPKAFQLAVEMDISRSTLFAHMKEYRVKMNEIRAIALEL
jgi:hypothetical protein